MRYLATLLLSILWMPNSYAQEFGTHWISHPLASDSAEVWFRKQYAILHCPQQAFISVASTGNYKLYINERNVTGSLIFEGLKGNVLLNRTIDVTRYLRKGNNIIAVWYAPQGSQSYGKQLSLEFYGWTYDSIPFYHKADGTWLCKQPKGCSLGEDELFDARNDTRAWKSEEFSSNGWLHPTGSTTSSTCIVKELKVIKDENKLYKVLSPTCTYSDSLGYNVDFGRSFYGTIRITLRGAQKGDRFHTQGYQYTCNGELDEQAFSRFKFQNRRVYTITGDARFRKRDIVYIEGLEVSE